MAAVCTLPWAMVLADEPPAPPLAQSAAETDATHHKQPKVPLLTPHEIDALILKAAEAETKRKLDGFEVVDDEAFLRRASLDVVGRPPTPGEVDEFLTDLTSERRVQAVDRLLANPEFGRAWAAYWSDTISSHVQPPELTFLDYGPFEKWLAERLNQNRPWDETVRMILAGTGKVAEHPEATFVAYHQGHPTRLASETARVFLGLQIQCAECHDHPFDHWTRDEFHHLAAYFARTEVKMPWNDGPETVVKDRGKGEYYMPDAKDPRKKGTMMAPVFLTGVGIDAGKSDLQRRRELAKVVTSPDNPWFARACVNRVWARLMGFGFYEPVDNLGEYEPHVLPELHERLAESFIASGFDMKALFRLIMSTEAYARRLARGEEHPFLAVRTTRLRGDEVYDSLRVAVGLPNITPPKRKATKEERFPPPPKSTRDLVAETFAYDPSRKPDEIFRTMPQAMLLMNNARIQQVVDGRPESDTFLAKLLRRETDDTKAVVALFRHVLARRPTQQELELALRHIERVGQRTEAFEDLLWSLVNTAEFTSRR